MLKDHQLKIGQWYTICCQRDIEQILSQDDIDYVINKLDDSEYIIVGDTKIGVIEEIRNCWLDAGQLGEVELCDKLIKEERSEMVNDR